MCPHDDALKELEQGIKDALRWQARTLALLACWLAVALICCAALAAQALAQIPHNATRYRAELTRAAHTQWGLDAPIAAFAAQIHQESGWNPQAVSRVGAKGMAQFMPSTAQWWCDINKMSADECQPSNPTWAMRALVGYDKHLFDRAPPRLSDFDRLWVALRAYNGGLGHWLAEAKATGLPAPTREQVDAACGKARRHISHCPENLGYTARILGMLQQRYESWGPVWTDTGSREGQP